MGKTSKKLYGIKNKDLNSKLKKIGAESDEELLLLNQPSEYDQMFRDLGVESKQSFAASQLHDSKEIELFQTKFENKEAFKGYSIKKLCNKYDLRILPIRDLKGYLTDSSMKAIKEFNTKFDKTILTDSTIYILAPRECFYKEYIGKEVKTFIIFYKDKSNNTGTSYRKVHKEDVVNQIHSSGNDFSIFRVFNQLFLKRRYQKGDGMPRLYSNILISLILTLSIIIASFGHIITASIFFLIYLIIMALNNNNVKEYKKTWNSFPETSNHTL